jgi:hypothetical protein
VPHAGFDLLSEQRLCEFGIWSLKQGRYRQYLINTQSSWRRDSIKLERISFMLDIAHNCRKQGLGQLPEKGATVGRCVVPQSVQRPCWRSMSCHPSGPQRMMYGAMATAAMWQRVHLSSTTDVKLARDARTKRRLAAPATHADPGLVDGARHGRSNDTSSRRADRSR